MSKFPQEFTSTVSHWQATNRGPGTLYGHGRDDALPTDILDYVIIGAGLTGCSLAYQLSKHRPDSSICILEAKDVASGASGRNGGHIAPYTPTAFTTLSAPQEEGGAGLDNEGALEVVYHEMYNYRCAAETIHHEGWAVDLWEGERLEIITSDEGLQRTKDGIEAFLAAKEKSPKYKDYPLYHDLIEDPEKVLKLSRMPRAKAVLKYPSGSVHPHKLATAYLKTALKSPTCQAFSWAPVNGFSHTDGIWHVDAGTRGTIRAKEVVVCTNAHTGWLFEGTDIQEHLNPYRGMCAQITPPPNFAGSGSLAYTGAAEGACYHMTLPTGQLVIGAGNAALLAHGLIKREETFGVVDDSNVHESTSKFLADYCRSHFDGWKEEAKGEGLMRDWSGIMCSSRDTLPLVGRVPGKDGLWIAVGFHGHGMSRIPATTKSLAQYIITGQWETSLPSSFEITEERLKRGKKNSERWRLNLGLDTLEDPGLVTAPRDSAK